MAKQVGATADVLLKRVYAYGGIAHTIDFAIAVLSRCQRTLNAFSRSVTATSTLTTLTNKLIYSIPDDLTDAVDVLEVTESSRELFTMHSISAFGAYSTTFFRDVGTRFEAWRQIGRDLLFVYPAKAAGSSCSVLHSKYTTELIARTDLLELPDEEVEALIGLAEIVLLARDRKVKVCEEKLEKLGVTLALNIESKQGETP